MQPAAVDLLSPQFWRSLAHILTEVWEASELELERLSYQQDLLLFQAAIIGDKKTDDIAKMVDRSYEALRGRLQPWYRKQREETVKQLARDMDAQWAAAWGDPNDPAIKAKIEEARKSLQPQKRNAPPVTAKQSKPGKTRPAKWQPRRARAR